MKKLLSIALLGVMLSFTAPCFAGTHGTAGQVSNRSIGASLCSLIIWPGIGQFVNGADTDKNVTHAVLGLTGVFRFWSFYDALVDRKGGVWHNRI